MTVRRFDSGRLDAPTKTPEGFLRVPATIARTGIQVYRQPDGSERREYRPPEEVGHKDALASFSLKPLTLKHPPERVTADNATKYSVGTIGEQIGFDKDKGLVGCTALITDAKAIAAVEQGMRQLSCGYDCDVVEEPGETPDGEKYEAVQKNIRGNHVSIVPSGRAGPGVALKLDANNDAVHDFDPDQPRDEKGMWSGGAAEATKAAEHQKAAAEHQAAGAATTNERARTAHANAAVEHKQAAAMHHANAMRLLNGLPAETSAAEKQSKVAEKASRSAKRHEKAGSHTDAALTEDEGEDEMDAAHMKAAVRARVALEKKAGALAPGLKLDELDDVGVYKAVLAKTQSDLKLDGKSDDYLAAAFDSAFAAFQKTNPAAYALAAVLAPDREPTEQQRMDSELDELEADPRLRFIVDSDLRSGAMGRGPEAMAAVEKVIADRDARLAARAAMRKATRG